MATASSPSKPGKKSSASAKWPIVVSDSEEATTQAAPPDNNRNTKRRKMAAASSARKTCAVTATSSRAKGKQLQQSRHAPASSARHQQEDHDDLDHDHLEPETPHVYDSGMEQDAQWSASELDINEYDLDDDFIDDSKLPANTGDASIDVYSDGEENVPPPSSQLRPCNTQTVSEYRPPIAPVYQQPPLITLPPTPSGSVVRPSSSTCIHSSLPLTPHPNALQSPFATHATPSQYTLPPSTPSLSPSAQPQPPPSSQASGSSLTIPPNTATVVTLGQGARPRQAFGSVLPSTPTGQSQTTARNNSQATLEDVHFRTILALPHKCEVTSLTLQDPLLCPYYANLPCLCHGTFQPWTDTPGPGMVQFSQWAEFCPSMSFDLCISAPEFRSSGGFINPSRISPLGVTVHEYPGTRPRYHLHNADKTPAICVSAIFCKESHLMEAATHRLRIKFLLGIFHSQEWERLVGFICTVFDLVLIHAQLGMDSIQFATCTDFSTCGDFGGSPGGMFSNIRSPSVASRSCSTAAPSSDTFALPCEAEVPVYDARDVDIDFNVNLPTLDTLPRWSGEIPTGSFVVVGYTVAVYKAASGTWNVSLNIQWAVILGIPVGSV